MTQHYRSIIIVIAVSLILSFLHCPLFEIFFDDKEIFKYFGLVIAKGGVPYRDFFDHKPPLIFFLNYAGLMLGSWGLWFIDTLLVLAASISFYKLCKKYKLIYVWLLPVLFNLMIRDRRISMGIGMTREYTAIFLLFFICIVFSNSRFKFYWLGLFAGLTFFMQQDQVLPMVPFWLFAFFSDKLTIKRVLGKVALSGAGLLTIAAPLTLYFIYHHSLQYFWQDAFLFNFNWYNQHYPLSTNLKAIKNQVNQTAYEIPFYIAAILAINDLFKRTRNRGVLIGALAALALSFSAAILSGKFIVSSAFLYYLLPLSVTLPVLIFIVFSGTEWNWLKEKNAQLTVGCMLCISLLFSSAQYILHLPVKTHQPSEQLYDLEYLHSQNVKDYDLYIAFNSNYVMYYNDLRILAPSKWVYHFFWEWFDRWDADLAIFDSIQNDLLRHRTKYIIDYAELGFAFKNKKIQEAWKLFLDTHYTPVDLGSKKTSGGRLWKLKGIGDKDANISLPVNSLKIDSVR